MPLVALETAVLTHGLPSPLNVETALDLEAIVRAEGAEPRTTGVVDGQLLFGMREDQIRFLATADDVVKISLRDLPVVGARGQSGGTTVAASLHIAAHHAARVFATGGIGGVHRRIHADDPVDISADLTALGRYSVCTVCAGAKSILDLPATIEMLETLGVTVLGYQTDTFPAFYSRSSGLPVDARVDNVKEAAEVIVHREQSGLPGGTLLAVPVPHAAEVAAEIIEPVIQDAVQQARDLGLRSGSVTPFILRRMAELVGDDILNANVALLQQNAAIAARLAVELADLSPSTFQK